MVDSPTGSSCYQKVSKRVIHMFHEHVVQDAKKWAIVYVYEHQPRYMAKTDRCSLELCHSWIGILKDPVHGDLEYREYFASVSGLDFIRVQVVS